MCKLREAIEAEGQGYYGLSGISTLHYAAAWSASSGGQRGSRFGVHFHRIGCERALMRENIIQGLKDPLQIIGFQRDVFIQLDDGRVVVEHESLLFSQLSEIKGFCEGCVIQYLNEAHA